MASRTHLRAVQTVPANIRYRNAAEALAPVVTRVPHGDLRALALAAARLLFQPAEQCYFSLRHNEDGTFIEALTRDATASVGPFRGPARPKSLSAVQGLLLGDLLAHLGAATGANDYAVKITYHGATRKPRRSRTMSDGDYASAMASHQAESARQAARGGFRTISYEVPPGRWTADDLTEIVGRVYAILPAPLAAFREIRFDDENWTGRERRRPNPGYALTICGDPFNASLCLPEFPGSALAEWLERRSFTLSVRIPEAEIARAALGTGRRHAPSARSKHAR